MYPRYIDIYPRESTILPRTFQHTYVEIAITFVILDIKSLILGTEVETRDLSITSIEKINVEVEIYGDLAYQDNAL